MAVSPLDIPERKRRTANVSDLNLLQSLFLITQEISLSKPLEFPPQRRNSASIIRKTKLLSILFEEILRFDPIPLLPSSAILCFKEIYIVLQRIKIVLENCSSSSKMWLLMQNETVSNSFHELQVDLSTLLDILSLGDLDLGDDVREQVQLVKKQCRRSKLFVDPTDNSLRSNILIIIEKIELEIVPDGSKLRDIFVQLGLKDSKSCRNEIKCLEDEIHDQTAEKQRATIVALIGLVRYAKCVLFGVSSPRSHAKNRSPGIEHVFPADFRCPISLDLMRDPVVVATGQTYDRDSISRWIESGPSTCPKTGQPLSNQELIPNRALTNLIARWCRENNIPFQKTDPYEGSNGVATNKAAMEATKMTAVFLVQKLADYSISVEAANRVVHELRLLAKTGTDNRACIADAGAVPLLVPLLGSESPSLQVNAVTTLLNLSILEANKKRIMETAACVDGVIEVLQSGLTWEARENAAATLLSLSALREYRKQLGTEPRVVQGLSNLAKSGPTTSKKDALATILNLAGDRESVGNLLGGGVVEVAMESASDDEVAEEAVAILTAISKRGGSMAVAATHGVVGKMVKLLTSGTERAKECAAAVLVAVCRKGRKEVVAEFAATPGIERVILELMATGTPRARIKAAALGRVCHRWVMSRQIDRTVGFSSQPSMLQA